MKQKLLLLEDVLGLGRSGELVEAKPGYVRNFLLPQRKAVIAGLHTIKMQATLKLQREQQAVSDRKESEELVARLEGLVLSTVVKIDPEGKMYGSVSAMDISRMLKEKGHEVDRKNIFLPHPLKTIGSHTIPLKLKEGVEGSIVLEIIAE